MATDPRVTLFKMANDPHVILSIMSNSPHMILTKMATDPWLTLSKMANNSHVILSKMLNSPLVILTKMVNDTNVILSNHMWFSSRSTVYIMRAGTHQVRYCSRLKTVHTWYSFKIAGATWFCQNGKWFIAHVAGMLLVLVLFKMADDVHVEIPKMRMM